jgi:hypothetical protein
MCRALILRYLSRPATAATDLLDTRALSSGAETAGYSIVSKGKHAGSQDRFEPDALKPG